MASKSFANEVPSASSVGGEGDNSSKDKILGSLSVLYTSGAFLESSSGGIRTCDQAVMSSDVWFHA